MSQFLKYIYDKGPKLSVEKLVIIQNRVQIKDTDNFILKTSHIDKVLEEKSV